MDQPEIGIYPIPGLPEIAPGVCLPELIRSALTEAALPLRDYDVLVVAHKVVSKAEGKMVALSQLRPSAKAREWAARYGKDARLVELVLTEARNVIRMASGVLITETRHGFICANSGVDTSNVPDGWAVTLPDDPDYSAEAIRKHLADAFSANIGVVVSDTFGRPWREGLVNVAIGVAGFDPFVDYRGSLDTFGKTLTATRIAAADQLAGASELVMGKTKRVPVALVRGFHWVCGWGTAKQLQRAREKDLFR